MRENCHTVNKQLCPPELLLPSSHQRWGMHTLTLAWSRTLFRTASLQKKAAAQQASPADTKHILLCFNSKSITYLIPHWCYQTWRPGLFRLGGLISILCSSTLVFPSQTTSLSFSCATMTVETMAPRWVCQVPPAVRDATSPLRVATTSIFQNPVRASFAPL